MDDQELLAKVRALRAKGRSPKAIARALGLRPAAAIQLVQTVAREEANAPESDVVGCWVSTGWSEGIRVEGHPEWPGVGASGSGGIGLVGVVVAREHRRRLSACGYLVDVYCLGVKDSIGPRRLHEHELKGFVRQFFGAFESAPLSAPIELAEHLVLGAVDYARRLGFEPDASWPSVRSHLGPWSGLDAITFGRQGKPFFVQGPRDHAPTILRTLEASVGMGGFHFMVAADGDPVGVVA